MNFIVSFLTSLIAILIYLSTGKIPSERNRLAVRAISFLIGTFAAIASISRLLVIVPAGNIGVLDLFGQVSQRTLNPGINLVNPFAKVVNFSTRLQDVKENVAATSQEGLSLNLDVSLQYKLDPQRAAQVYKNIGTDATELMVSRFRSTIRAITANYPATAIYSTKRQEIAQQLNEQASSYLPWVSSLKKPC